VGTNNTVNVLKAGTHQQHEKNAQQAGVQQNLQVKSAALSDTGGNSLGVLVKEGAAYEVVHDQHLASCQLTLLNLVPPVQQDTSDCAL